MPHPSIPDLQHRLVPGRRIEGISAVLLPISPAGKPDLAKLEQLLETTWSAGLTPAVNMDTGFANLISDDERSEILRLTRMRAGQRLFVAGAFVEGRGGDPEALYREQVDAITAEGGLPILFPSQYLRAMCPDALVAFFRRVGEWTPAFLGFELGEMFVPFGRIFDEETFTRLLEIPELTGVKHSSLRRDLEWQRLEIRDRLRPDFRVYTGNDLAIDMVQWGSDYLLGLSAFHPEAFALRDQLWERGDPRFFELNDLLQYLGQFAFRAPVPAYKHSCAQFLALRGILTGDETHPESPRRPETDRAILEELAERLDHTVSVLQPILA